MTVKARTGLAVEVARVRSVPLDAPRDEAGQPPELARHEESPEAWLAGAQIRELVAARFAAIAADGPHPEAVLAAVGGTRPADAAEEHGVPVVALYRALERLRRHARRDPHLRELHALS